MTVDRPYLQGRFFVLYHCLEVSVRYHLMRQDEHGGTTIIACWTSVEAAECQRVKLESGEHKQYYWIQPTEQCSCEGER